MRQPARIALMPGTGLAFLPNWRFLPRARNFRCTRSLGGLAVPNLHTGLHGTEAGLFGAPCRDVFRGL